MNEPIDRHSEPIAALRAANAALDRRDIEGYFDALADPSILLLLRNAVATCSAAPDSGCQGLLREHGWVEPRSGAPQEVAAVWQRSFEALQRKRELAPKLEAYIREKGIGNSFAWDHLRNVRVEEVIVEGKIANGIARWGDSQQRIAFKLDETGWRVDLWPDLH